MANIKSQQQHWTHFLVNKDCKILTRADYHLLQPFFDECGEKGFKNNDSFESVKFDWCIANGGRWYGSILDGRLVAMSGIHPFKDGWRVLFRTVQLEPIPNAPISKFHHHSWCWYHHLPYAYTYTPGPFYVTTNHLPEDDKSGKMNRVHKFMQHFEKLGLCEYKGVEEHFYTKQGVWLMNDSKYFSTRFA